MYQLNIPSLYYSTLKVPWNFTDHVPARTNAGPKLVGLYTMDSRYIAFEYKTILNAMRKLKLYSVYEPTKEIPYLALTGELWRVAFVRILKNIDCVIMIPHCIVGSLHGDYYIHSAHVGYNIFQWRFWLCFLQKYIPQGFRYSLSYPDWNMAMQVIPSSVHTDQIFYVWRNKLLVG